MLLIGWSRLDWIRFLPQIMGAAKLAQATFFAPFLGAAKKGGPPGRAWKTLGASAPNNDFRRRRIFKEKGRIKAALPYFLFPVGV